MKKNLLISLLVLTTFWGSSQIPTISTKDTLKLMSGIYVFKYSIPKEASPQFISTSQIEVKRDYLIRVLYEYKSEVYFEYLKFKDSDNVKLFNNNQVFRIDKNVFEQLTTRLLKCYKGVTAGTYTVPLRLRGVFGSDFDFEPSLSISENLVFGFGSQNKTESFLDLSIGLGITQIKLDSLVSNVTDSRSSGALTVSLGGVIKPSEFVNFGVFVGYDFLGKSDRDVDWIFNNKPWIGLGVNISFEKIPTNESANITMQKKGIR